MAVVAQAERKMILRMKAALSSCGGSSRSGT
jgi:hypothetical protein